jgi:hypothetical protein
MWHSIIRRKGDEINVQENFDLELSEKKFGRPKIDAPTTLTLILK